jgi:four helix bundle protein
MWKFMELNVWKRAKDLAVFVFRMTGEEPFNRDFSLRDQIRHAAVSMPSNIAEGDELDTNKQAIKYFYIAKGSSAEVLTQAVIAVEIKYIDSETFEYIKKECSRICSMLMRLIKARTKSLYIFSYSLEP